MPSDPTPSRDDLLAELSALRRRLAECERPAEPGAPLPEADLLQSIFENVDLGMVVVGPDFKIKNANAKAARIFGFPGPAEIVGQQCFSALGEGEGVCQDCPGLKAMSGSGRAESERRATLRNGQTVVLRIQAFPTHDKDGALAGFFEVVEDVTERKRAEAELAELNAHLEHLVSLRTRGLLKKAQDLKLANLRLMELDEMKSSFLSSVSHELRTPLTSIMGFAKLINKDFGKSFSPLAGADEVLLRRAGRIRENLGIIEREGERLTRLINDVLDLNKIESGRIEWHDQETDLAKVVERSVEAVRGQFAMKPDVALKSEVAKGLPRLFLDPDRLQQVLVNLLNNAAKFTDKGRVAVRVAAPSPGLVEVRVEDTGTGIPAKELPKIFDKFHQVRTGDTVGEKGVGTGLGLAICRQIVEHYGGRVHAESEPGQGSTFVVRLPVRAAEHVPAEAGGPREEAALHEVPLILVVDDDPVVSLYFQRLLEAQGYRVAQAHDGAQALLMAAKLRPDLITMDIMMPGFDGKTAINWMRKDPGLTRTPILAVSSYDEGLRSGADATLAKPIDAEQFLATVQGLLDLRTNPGPLLVLTRGASPQLKPFFALRESEAASCRPEEVFERIAGGFSGTVIVPASLAGEVDMQRLGAAKGVQVLILPETPPSRAADLSHETETP